MLHFFLDEKVDVVFPECFGDQFPQSDEEGDRVLFGLQRNLNDLAKGLVAFQMFGGIIVAPWPVDRATLVRPGRGRPVLQLLFRVLRACG